MTGTQRATYSACHNLYFHEDYEEMTMFDTTEVLGVHYAELDYTSATNTIIDWARGNGSHSVAVVAVHGLMMSRWNDDIGAAVADADMVTSDGVPIVWVRKLLGRKDATRLYGPHLTLHVMEACEQEGVPIALLGGRPERLEGLKAAIRDRYPKIKIAYGHSPGFGDISDEEVESIAEDIAASGARITFVGQGCPRQEIMMQRLKPMLPGVRLGVGAAFDFISGYVRQAPPILQRNGLEWAFRLSCEPRRLWKRYASTNPAFLFHAGLQVLEHRISQASGAA